MERSVPLGPRVTPGINYVLKIELIFLRSLLTYKDKREYYLKGIGKGIDL